MSFHRHVRLACAVALLGALAGVHHSNAAPPADVAGAPHYAAAKHDAKGAGGGSPKARYPDMTYHRGPVMPSAVVQPIFWGTSWALPLNDKMSGLASFYQGYSNSTYAKTSGEYADSTGQVVGPALTYQDAVVDPSAAVTTAPTTAQVLAEVAKEVPSPDPKGLGFYPVYVDSPRPADVDFCAWHSYGSVNGTPVQIAFFWNLDGDAGCDNVERGTTHSQGLAALANVSAHELSEARTDPRINAWYDQKYDENADKCAWTFGPTTTNPLQLSTLSNGTQWKLQGEWSNRAYDAGTGYPNSAGQAGCLAGY